MRRNTQNTGFLDLLFILVICMTGLFVLSFLIMSEQSKEDDSNIKTKAEYIITVVWPDGMLDDVDTWLMDPRGQKLHFRNKNIETAHLDRDDLGMVADFIIDANGNKIKYVHNQEITTIRVPVEGEWVLNLHMFRKRGTTPTTVEVKMDKLNPSVKTIFLRQIVMVNHYEEITVARFQMSKLGEIISWDERPRKLIGSELDGYAIYGGAPLSIGGEWP